MYLGVRPRRRREHQRLDPAALEQRRRGGLLTSTQSAATLAMYSHVSYLGGVVPTPLLLRILRILHLPGMVVQYRADR